MRHFWIFILILVCSCADIQEVPKPDNFYGDEKMADLMTDLYLIESTMTSNRSVFTSLEALPSDIIYAKYETDSINFRENLKYYADDNERYTELNELVEARLNVIRDSVIAREKREVLPELQEEAISRDPDNQ